SDLVVYKAFAQTDAPLWWNDTGHQGVPDATENASVAFFSLMAAGVQMAGPHISVQAFADGLHNLPATGGWNNDGHDPGAYNVGFKDPSPYTAAEDTREVNWSQARKSEIDGNPGSYCPIDHGHRFDLGQWPSGDPD